MGTDYTAGDTMTLEDQATIKFVKHQIRAAIGEFAEMAQMTTVYNDFDERRGNQHGKNWLNRALTAFDIEEEK